MAENNIPAVHLTRDDSGWQYSPRSFDTKEDVQRQHISDMQIWDRTLFSEKSTNVDSNTFSQQKVLRRHFLAMAYFGVNRLNGNSGREVPLESESLVPLAAIPSHGGRFAYQIDGPRSDEAMARFQSVLFTGDPDGKAIVHKDQKRAQKRPDKGDPGLFGRISTHGQKLETVAGGLARRWREIKLRTGERGQIGMNFPLGGIRSVVMDGKGRLTRVGPDGYASTEDGKKSYQLGSALFASRVSETNHSARMMVGFEGTAPRKSNQLGASHGFKSTFFGSILGIKKYKNERAITGQLKGRHAGLPDGLGALGASITESRLDGFCRLVKDVGALENHHVGRQELHDHFRTLLSSRTAAARDEAVRAISESAHRVAGVEPSRVGGVNRASTDDSSSIWKTVAMLGYDPRKLASRIDRGRPEQNGAVFGPVSGAAGLRIDARAHAREGFTKGPTSTTRPYAQHHQVPANTQQTR